MKSFEHDGVQLDMSGYAHDPRPHYFAVYSEGDSKPTDLVRVQPSGRTISLIDTIKERASSTRKGWQDSVFSYGRDDGSVWRKLTASEVQDVLSSQLSKFKRKAKAPTARLTKAQKQAIVSAFATGTGMSAISRDMGIDLPRVRRVLEQAEVLSE